MDVLTSSLGLGDGRLEEQQVSRCAIPDKGKRFVRHPRRIERRTMALQEKRIKDRRIQKTRNLLHEALGTLIREKPYDRIVVQEILDRANVGRSTFYTHFGDKDELLVSGIYDMLRSVQAAELPSSGKRCEWVIRFSLPIFEHIHRHRHAGAATMGIRGRTTIHEHLKKVLVELIDDDMKKLQVQRPRPAQVPTDLLVQYVASTFILVL